MELQMTNNLGNLIVNVFYYLAKTLYFGTLLILSEIILIAIRIVKKVAK